jgi:alkylation response protein AidB-like acyl-CoA dehydrogenase
VTHDDSLYARAGHVADLAEKHAQDADRTGRLAPEVVDAMRSAGFGRHFVPAELGGADGTFAELTEALYLIGRSCASTAWCASMLAYTARFCTHLPPAVQHETWGADPDTLWASGLVPSGRVEETADGYRLGGRWTYISGSDFVDWVILAGPQQGPPDALKPLFFAVPRSDFTVEETWNAVGMRATGSHTVVIEEALVPRDRVVPLAEVHGGVNRTWQRTALNVPLMAVGGLTCLSPVLGAAQGALSACISTVAGKRPGPPGSAVAGRDIPLARAAAEIDSATMLLARVAEVLDTGQSRPYGARNARDAAYAAQLTVSAVNGLMQAAGTTAQDQSSPLQRDWRDVTVATSHAALRFDRPATAYVEGQLKS